MSSQFYLVVGDAYETFANNENVTRASDFISALSEPEQWTGEERVVIGQGISTLEMDKIVSMLKTRGIRKVSCLGEQVPLHWTHKRHPDHVLISSPKNISPGSYQYQLALNDRMDRLCDHVTGQHIGAMQLMEATRQAMIATLELEYVIDTGKRIGLILERFDSKFENYVFPLPAHMSVKVVERSSGNDNHLMVTVYVGIVQAGQSMCQIEMDLTLYDVPLLEKIEARRARRSIATLMETFEEQSVPVSETV